MQNTGIAVRPRWKPISLISLSHTSNHRSHGAQFPAVLRKTTQFHRMKNVHPIEGRMRFERIKNRSTLLFIRRPLALGTRKGLFLFSCQMRWWPVESYDPFFSSLFGKEKNIRLNIALLYLVGNFFYLDTWMTKSDNELYIYLVHEAKPRGTEVSSNFRTE